ncbi:MAG: hypothetical protein ACREFP_15645 [Acetobacteraceae bacterium]
MLQLLQDQAPAEYDLPHAFSIACGTSANEAKAIEIAGELIDRALFADSAAGATARDAAPRAAERARAFFAKHVPAYAHL